MSRAEVHELTVAPEEAGQRLDRWLAARLGQHSRSRLKALVDQGQVRRDGAAVSAPAAKVQAGQVFAVTVPAAAPARPQGQAMDLEILYEDADLVVLNKPVGLVVHPAPGNPDRTLVNALIAHCGPSLTGIGGVQRPGIVHRLDKDTSGLMVAAKTEAAHRGLVEQFAARSVERSYLALVWGIPQPPRGEIEGAIGRSPRNRKKMALVSRGGRPAATGYELLKSYAGGRVGLVRCRLRTGRTHQIRVHMSARGHGLLGDRLYGRQGASRIAALPPLAGAAVKALAGQALHAESLGFRHPSRAETLNFRKELPYNLRALISLLE